MGVGIIGGSNNLIGGSDDGTENVISGNGFSYNQGGVGFNQNSENNVIKRNFIGTDLTGTKAIPNSQYGVFFYSSNNNTVGGKLLSEGNIISGNQKNGILVDYSSGISIKGNIIGLDLSGTKKLGNQSSGILLYSSESNAIGSTNYSERNIISGNERDGIRIWTNESMDNTVIGNIIGLSADEGKAIPNVINGVGIYGGSGNMIGGINSNEGNIIAGNGENGVLIKNIAKSSNKIGSDIIDPIDFANISLKMTHVGVKNYPNRNLNSAVEKLNKTISVNDSGYFNSVLCNSIYANGILGIDLFDISRTNDDQDGDIGSNAGQNFPEIISVTGDGTNAEIQYSVNSSTTNSAYPIRVEFFLADENGQGKLFLGNDIYFTSDAMKSKTFNFAPSISIGVNEKIVATATDANGNTSEFSDPFTTSSVVNVEEINDIPSIFSLSQNYPNPFNPNTTIKYTIPMNVKRETSNVKLVIYDVLGKEVKTLLNQNNQPGNYEIRFDASELPSGVYYYTLKFGNFSETKKMILLK